MCVGWNKKVTAKVGEENSFMEVGLCIGCPRLVGRMTAGNSSMQEFLHNPVQLLSSQHLLPFISGMGCEGDKGMGNFLVGLFGA